MNGPRLFWRARLKAAQHFNQIQQHEIIDENLNRLADIHYQITVNNFIWKWGTTTKCGEDSTTKDQLSLRQHRSTSSLLATSTTLRTYCYA